MIPQTLKTMESLTWECADIILEEALGLSCLGHEACEGPLHVPPLGSRLLPQHLVVGHRLPVGLGQGKERDGTAPTSKDHGHGGAAGSALQDPRGLGELQGCSGQKSRDSALGRVWKMG